MKSGIIISLIILVAASSSARQVHTSTGTVKRFMDFRSVHVQPRNVDVWLPDGYSPDLKYAVLYMHDGQMLFDSTTTWNHQEWGVDETVGRLIAEDSIRHCIVVGIWNNGSHRHSEYFPQKPFEHLPESARKHILDIRDSYSKEPVLGAGPVSDNYLKFIVFELKPFIDSAFSTLSDQKNTFIAGSSMGGLISFYALCEYPDVFGGAACISTHWPGTFETHNNPVPGAFLDYLRAHIPSPENHKFYFDYGTATLDSLYRPYQVRADSIMKRRGFTGANWITREFPGDDHSEQSWRKRLAVPMLFLMGK